MVPLCKAKPNKNNRKMIKKPQTMCVFVYQYVYINYERYQKMHKGN